jgi:excisionase family DNA binding protein
MTETLMTLAEVAELFKVTRRTVERWLTGDSPKLTRVNTPGGQPRVKESEVIALLARGGWL